MTETDTDDRDPLYHLRRAIAAAPDEFAREEEILRETHDRIVTRRAGNEEDPEDQER